MKLPSEGYFSKFNQVEIARYFPEKGKLSRVMDHGQPVFVSWDDIYDFSAKYDDLGIYHSIRHYDPTEGLTGPSLAPMHFDIDDKDNPQQAYIDTQKLLHYLMDDVSIPYNAIRVYFSGMKGYHLEIEPISIRMNLVHENSAAIFRFVAEEIEQLLDIKSFDHAVYDPRRIWRLAGSRHQKTGLYKTPCKDLMLAGATIEEIAKVAEVKPSWEDLEVPEQEFDFHAAMFFSEMVAKYETEIKQREQDKLSNFLSYGHTQKGGIELLTKEFTPNRIRNLCPAVDNIINKAYNTHYLDHYERLFLCSLFTYTPDAVKYLHQVLSQCDDYNFSISDLHIQDWIRRREMEIGGRPYTCAKAKMVGIVCFGCEELEPKSYENNLGGSHIADPSPVRFAYKYHDIGE